MCRQREPVVMTVLPPVTSFELPEKPGFAKIVV
jgi:hypothetical protein